MLLIIQPYVMNNSSITMIAIKHCGEISLQLKPIHSSVVGVYFLFDCTQKLYMWSWALTQRKNT